MLRGESSRRAGIAVLLIGFLLCLACDPMDHPLQPTVMELNGRPRPAWYDRAKLGIFIHWGPYAVPGVGEWYWFNMYYDPFTREYHRTTYGEDYPYEAFGHEWADVMNRCSSWDPDAWADFFSQTGARYVVLTTKHHDGFLLWPSDTPNPRAASWQLERDVVGELGEAVRARGLRFGTYYSGGHDWTLRFPLGPGPIRQLQAHLNNEEEGRYVESHYRELIERYRPSLLWNDISYPAGQGFEHKWGMIADYYARVPEGVINDRFLDSSFIQRPLDRNPWLYDLLDWLLGYGRERFGPAGTSRVPSPASPQGPGEMDLQDLIDAYEPPHYGFLTREFSEADQIEPTKWERCRTLGSSWGYNRFETGEDMLSGKEVIQLLADVVSKNGNLLINVGPMADGTIPEIQQVPLLAMGRWLEVNGEAIYNTRPWRKAEGVTDSGLPVRFTQNRWTRKVYAIVLGQLSGESVVLTDFVPNAGQSSEGNVLQSAPATGVGRDSAGAAGRDDFAADPVYVELLGAGPCPGWSQGEGGLRVELPALLPVQEAYAFAITRFAQDFLPPAPPGKSWTLAWSDEFSGEALDPDKWSHSCEVPCPRRDGYWTGDAAYLDGKGNLVMAIYERGGSYYDGSIHTQGKFEHIFGYYEARIKLHQDGGHWPAFWLMSDGVGSVGEEGRDGTEIDIMEKPWAGGLLKSVTNHAMHWDGYGPEGGRASRISFTAGIMEGYHTYGLWWSPDEYVFYIDGKEVWRTAAGGVSQVPEYVILSDEIGRSFVFMDPIQRVRLPDFWSVDYVRVFDLVDGP